MIETEKLDKFQQFIGYKFNEISLLEKTLTTKAFGNQNHTPHFEGMDNAHAEYFTEDEYLSAKLIEA